MDFPVSPRRVAARRGFFSQYTHHHLVVFLLTFFSYALLHASRKAFSNVKVSIINQWTPSDLNTSVFNVDPNKTWNGNSLFPNHESATIFLGLLDTIFLFSYAVGLFVSGIIGDRLNMRYVLTFGMCLSAVTMFVFGTVTEWLHFYNKIFYCLMWVINGLLQSTGWPCVVAVMGNWFGKSGYASHSTLQILSSYCPQRSSQSNFPISMSLESGRKPPQIRREHINSMQMLSAVEFKPRTPALQNTSANHGDTMRL